MAAPTTTAPRQKQHVDAHRKVKLRRDLLADVEVGAAYVPFIGDGDLAAELYVPAGFTVFGADLDPDRVATAAARIEAGEVVAGDCDGWPPFTADLSGELFTVADFDAYAYPYASFRAALGTVTWADRVAMFFTDGERQAVKRSRGAKLPTGEHLKLTGVGTNERRRYYNAWWSREVLPWFTAAVAPFEVVRTTKYLRADMLYWGAVIAAP